MSNHTVQAAAEGLSTSSPTWRGHSAAFDQLHGGISRLLDLARVQEVLSEQLLTLPRTPGRLANDEAEALAFIASEIRTEAGALSDRRESLCMAEPVPAKGGDPLFTAVKDYQAKRAAWIALPDGADGELFREQNVEPCWKRLHAGQINATTAYGAEAALGLVLDEQRDGSKSLLAEPLIRGALAYIRMETSA